VILISRKLTILRIKLLKFIKDFITVIFICVIEWENLLMLRWIQSIVQMIVATQSSSVVTRLAQLFQYSKRWISHKIQQKQKLQNQSLMFKSGTWDNQGWNENEFYFF